MMGFIRQRRRAVDFFLSSGFFHWGIEYNEIIFSKGEAWFGLSTFDGSKECLFAVRNVESVNEAY